jgi:hypothetical protein
MSLLICRTGLSATTIMNQVPKRKTAGNADRWSR